MRFSDRNLSGNTTGCHEVTRYTASDMTMLLPANSRTLSSNTIQWRGEVTRLKLVAIVFIISGGVEINISPSVPMPQEDILSYTFSAQGLWADKSRRIVYWDVQSDELSMASDRSITSILWETSKGKILTNTTTISLVTNKLLNTEIVITSNKNWTLKYRSPSFDKLNPLGWRSHELSSMEDRGVSSHSSWNAWLF